MLAGNVNHERIVQFHKLSQWLCDSLTEPLQWANVKVDNQDALTALPECRNGGWLLDTGVIHPKSPGLLHDLLDLRIRAGCRVAGIDSQADGYFGCKSAVAT